ncbi:MAG TPA: hypothetical protein VMT74_07880 [Gaiellaceae bacterium]|nr:hypothetical protein [Gaiellaceae bacterium]
MKRLALAVAAASALVSAQAGIAGAESVPGSAGATDAMLAVAADGSPRVAFAAADGSLVVASRTADGIWADEDVAGLPGAPLVVGLAAGPAGAVVLAEDPQAHWLDLAEQRAGGWTVRTVARAPAGGLLGFAGLALDHGGRPLIAYAYELRSRKTWLRLVHEDAQGRLAGERVTRAGFPSSDVLPAAAPVVLPSGAVRVVEAYDTATIEWARTKSRTDWIGQFLYGSALGSPAGVLKAVAGPSGVWSAWTELFPSLGESQLVLALHLRGESSTVLFHHAFLVSLALSPTGPEVGGDDYVDLEGLRTVYAGLVVDAAGNTLELDGDLKGYEVDAAGGRQYLLQQPDGLDWYRAAAPPAARVTLAAGVQGASFALSGSVGGVTSGSVELYRETEAGQELFATAPVAADGTFSTVDLPPTRPLLYRAVYVDPSSGLPIASLVRTVLGG